MVYTITKGTHDSTLLPGFTFSNSANYKVKFFDNCKYISIIPTNQGDINKLYGFTEGFSGVHTNSARFGWSYNLTTEKIDLYSYCYVNSLRISLLIGSVAINETVNLSLVRERSTYKFYVNSELKNTVPKKSGLPYMSVKCYPYFGGDEVAPYDINIELV